MMGYLKHIRLGAYNRKEITGGIMSTPESRLRETLEDEIFDGKKVQELRGIYRDLVDENPYCHCEVEEKSQEYLAAVKAFRDWISVPANIKLLPDTIYTGYVDGYETSDTEMFVGCTDEYPFPEYFRRVFTEYFDAQDAIYKDVFGDWKEPRKPRKKKKAKRKMKEYVYSVQIDVEIITDKAWEPKLKKALEALQKKMPEINTVEIVDFTKDNV